MPQEQPVEHLNQRPPERPPKIAIDPQADLKTAAASAMRDGIVLVRFHQEAALRGEVEPLHQMRVASRRLRAAVEVFASVMHGARVNVYRGDLRWLGQVAGAVRECDMTAVLIRQQAARLDAAMAAELEPVYQRLLATRETAREGLAAMTATRRYRMLGERLMNPLIRRVVPEITVGEHALRLIAPIAVKTRKAGKRVMAEAPAEMFHTLRKRIKRLRYAFEMLSGAGGRHHRHAIERLEQMQEILGEHHDAVALGAWLRELAGVREALPAATMMAAGALIQELGRHEAKLKLQSLKLWKQFRRADVIGEALKEIAGEAAGRRRERLKAIAEANRNGAPVNVAAQADNRGQAEAVADKTDNPVGTENAA
ncbi:MAG TPA: CHAD domain-containing protein [Candidatus Binataceae bacterium]|nr:CHAD domain-containing protein [Candidatus Binataceae bacterium]